MNMRTHHRQTEKEASELWNNRQDSPDLEASRKRERGLVQALKHIRTPECSCLQSNPNNSCHHVADEALEQFKQLGGVISE